MGWLMIVLDLTHLKYIFVEKVDDPTVWKNEGVRLAMSLQ